MLTLGRLVAGKYVTVGPIVVPATGVIENGALTNTDILSTTAATNRSSPKYVTACPDISPCGAPKCSVVEVDPAAAVPPTNRAGVLPRVAWKSGP